MRQDTSGDKPPHILASRAHLGPERSPHLEPNQPGTPERFTHRLFAQPPRVGHEMMVHFGKNDAAVFFGFDVRDEERAAGLEERREDPRGFRYGGEMMV